MRINKYLADCGVGSRRHVEEYIVGGKVSVNGVIVTDLSTQINENDIVKFNNKVVQPVDKFVYYILNKPKGYLTTVTDMYNRKTVMDLMQDINIRIYPVGRLDYDTEGLLLFTNDGNFANKVIHPSANIKKTYEVVLSQPLTLDDTKKITSGMTIDGYKTTPAVISQSKVVKGKYVFQLTIFEGRNRQIRKMMEMLYKDVVSLKRISIGKLTIGSLKVGEYRSLTQNEIQKIFL